MPAFLLDTNVVAELRKTRPDANVLHWFARYRKSDSYVSALVVGEIRQGVERLRSRDPVRAKALEEWLDGLIDSYENRILPVTAEIADEWGRLNATPRPIIDGLMAATAKVHELTLVTRNVADVAGLGIRVVDPFRPVSSRSKGQRHSS